MHDESDPRQERIERHLLGAGQPRSRIEGDSFDVWIFEDLLWPGTLSLFSVGLSQFPVAGGGMDACAFEMHLLMPACVEVAPYASALMDAGERYLERFHDLGMRPELGEVLVSKPLLEWAATSQASHLGALLVGWSVWLPSQLGWIEGADLEHVAIVDLVPITSAEERLIEVDRARFEALTASGQVDLLDFSRAGQLHE